MFNSSFCDSFATRDAFLSQTTLCVAYCRTICAANIATDVGKTVTLRQKQENKPTKDFSYETVTLFFLNRNDDVAHSLLG